MNLEAADVSTRKLSKMEAKCDTRSKSKLFSKTNAKPLTGTLDRWFKPANGAANDKKASNKTKSFEPVVNANDDEKNMRPQVSKSVRSSRNFVQRYIHINDECRVCESAKIEEAARCELRCATCSLTVHKKCYNVRGEVSDKEWNCRRCQYIYRETAWEDISGLIGVPNPESLTFPTCEPPDNNHKMHQLFTDSNFAAIFLFLQRFSRLGLQLLNVDTTLENLANALIEPKAGKLCEELHTRLLKNINVVTKKDPWYVLLWHFLREEENVPVIVKNTKFLANSVESEKREDLYLGLPVKERLAMLKLLCEAQFDRNAILVEKIGHEEAESMRNEQIGMDAAGRCYFLLEDAATVSNAAVWVCRCLIEGGTDWETVCNDLESIEVLVQQLSLSVNSAELQLWQVLSRGALKKLFRQQEKNKRKERWQHDLACTELFDSSEKAKDLGRRSLRNRQLVNYAKLDGLEGEDLVKISAESDCEEDLSDASIENDPVGDTDEEYDADNNNLQPRRAGRNSVDSFKRRRYDSHSTHRRKRHSPHERSQLNLRRSIRNLDPL